MFTLCSDISIGGLRFKGVHYVEVESSIYELSAKAVVKVPVTAVLKQSGQPSTRVETAQTIKRGDKVSIKLGYNGRLFDEFNGYVKNINLATPIEIECEDEFYTCRGKQVKLKGTTTLADLLKLCGLKVQQCETLTLKNFALNNNPTPSVAQVIGKLQTDYGLNCFFDLNGNFYAVRPERMQSEVVKYELRRNVINDDELIYRKADDVKIEIKAICIKKDGTKVEATKGATGGTAKTLYFYDVEDMTELATLADAELKRNSYDGYEGEIETFLAPFATPTMVAHVTDPVYGQRDGKYYIEGVKTTFGMEGGRRKITIGTKI